MLERFFYSPENEDNKKEESLNNYKYLFSKLKDNIPNLSDALDQMFKSKNIGNEKVKQLIEVILDKCKSTIDKRNKREI